MERKARSWSWVLVVAMAALVVGPVPRLRAADNQQEVGHATYRKYCGACHGPDGRGDGIAGVLFRPKAPDLTQLPKYAGGTFPYEPTLRYIDGRETVRAHGDPDMPVWGEIFRQDSAWSMEHSAEIRGKLMLITDYLRSIQQK